MEQLVAHMPGRTNPRWSRLFTGGAAQTVASPLLIAGLPASSAMVCVGPPLLAPATQLLELQSVFWVQLAPAFVPPTQSPAGSSSGFVLQNEVPVVVAQLAPVKPHLE